MAGEKGVWPTIIINFPETEEGSAETAAYAKRTRYVRLYVVFHLIVVESHQNTMEANFAHLLLYPVSPVKYNVVDRRKCGPDPSLVNLYGA